MWAANVYAVLWQVLCFENTADGRTSKRAEAAPVLAKAALVLAERPSVTAG
jgi:hypothetical protein